MAVRALFSLCAFSHLWRDFQYTGYFTENPCNSNVYSVLKYRCPFLMSWMAKLYKMSLSGFRLCFGAQNDEKLLYFIMQKHYLGLKFRVFLLIVYAKFNFKKCARLWKALVRLFTPVCATFCEIIWQY